MGWLVEPEFLWQSQDSFRSLLIDSDRHWQASTWDNTRTNGSSNWTMDSLRMALKNEINIPQTEYRTEAPNVPSSTVSFLAGTGATHPYRKDNKPAIDRRSQEKKCQFCGDKHLANECKKVTAVSARKKSNRNVCVLIVWETTLCHHAGQITVAVPATRNTVRAFVIIS